MSKPICTKENPAILPTKVLWNGNRVKVWNHDYEHPDQERECIDDIHEDYRYWCPHCLGMYYVEGSDY